MLGILGLLLALLLAVGSVYFGSMNQTPVSVTLLPGMAPRSAFIAEIALYAAIMGAVFSALSLLWAWLGVYDRCRQLRRRVRELEGQLKQRQPVVGEATLTALDHQRTPQEMHVPRPVAAHVDEEPI